MTLDNTTEQLRRIREEKERLEAENESKAAVVAILSDLQGEMEETQLRVDQRLQQLTNINTNILARLNSAERNYLQRMKIDRERSDEVDCSGVRARVKLDNLVKQDLGDLGEDNIFMIESSPKETLTSREGCALESAARNSELGVVMVRVGEMLDLGDNTTCQLYTR